IASSRKNRRRASCSGPVAPSPSFSPRGEVRTYRQLAQLLGTAPRAIGQAVGANPIPILIPCHRVVAMRGLGGYSGPGGLTSKERLLRLEHAC
ncbi:MAG: MGMT family protein, partial [Magnetococcales bacterium]|nr:MGMT family protein [Magnetococcales bacterium]